METELLATQAELLYAAIRAIIATTPGMKRHYIPKPWNMPRPRPTPSLVPASQPKPKRKASAHETAEIIRGWMNG